MESKSAFLKSFGYAIEGILSALKGRNFKIICSLGSLALLAGVLLKISSIEWVAILVTINIVVTAELLNTAVEATVDLVSPEIRQKAKIAKDVAVAGVLISSIFSVIVGVIIFLPKLISILV